MDYSGKGLILEGLVDCKNGLHIEAVKDFEQNC